MLVKPINVNSYALPGIREGMKFKNTTDPDRLYFGKTYTVDAELRFCYQDYWPVSGICGEFVQIIENPLDLFEYADYVEQNQTKESA